MDGCQLPSCRLSIQPKMNKIYSMVRKANICSISNQIFNMVGCIYIIEIFLEIDGTANLRLWIDGYILFFLECFQMLGDLVEVAECR